MSNATKLFSGIVPGYEDVYAILFLDPSIYGQNDNDICYTSVVLDIYKIIKEDNGVSLVTLEPNTCIYSKKAVISFTLDDKWDYFAQSNMLIDELGRVLNKDCTALIRYILDNCDKKAIVELLVTSRKKEYTLPKDTVIKYVKDKIVKADGKFEASSLEDIARLCKFRAYTRKMNDPVCELAEGTEKEYAFWYLNRITEISETYCKFLSYSAYSIDFKAKMIANAIAQLFVIRHKYSITEFKPLMEKYHV